MIFETGERHRLCHSFNHCAVCARPFLPGAVKYLNKNRRDERYIYWRLWNPIPPVCDECLTEEERGLRERDAWKNAGRCTVCGHPMRVLASYRTRYSRVVCSAACANRRFRDRHRVKATACSECGLVFQPARKDAAYCSNACRQHAYRRRLTADPSTSRCLSETLQPSPGSDAR